jgi:hypothetical protein
MSKVKSQHSTTGALHTLCDKLTVEATAHFAAQLPGAAAATTEATRFTFPLTCSGTRGQGRVKGLPSSFAWVPVTIGSSGGRAVELDSGWRGSGTRGACGCW